MFSPQNKEKCKLDNKSYLCISISGHIPKWYPDSTCWFSFYYVIIIPTNMSSLATKHVFTLIGCGTVTLQSYDYRCANQNVVCCTSKLETRSECDKPRYLAQAPGLQKQPVCKTAEGEINKGINMSKRLPHKDAPLHHIRRRLVLYTYTQMNSW
jgi:hypothetical protein